MRKILYVFLGLAAFLTSCEESSYDLTQGQPIYLSAVLNEIPLTKVPFQGSAPTTSNPLNVDVWASTTEKVFLHETDGQGNPLDGRHGNTNKVSVHTSGHFQSGAPQLLSQAVYPPPREGVAGSYTADPVYFVAMHPQSNGVKAWGTDDGTKAFYTFTGCEDLMFAPQVKGAYDTSSNVGQVVTDSPVLSFKHLLTRITVKMGIELEDGENLDDVKAAWGNVEDLQIQSYNSAGYGVNMNKVSLDLSKGSEFSYENDVTFSGIQGGSMGFYKIGTDNSFPGDGGYTLTEKIDSVAYVMCAPVVATKENHEYVIIVSTKNRGVHELKFDLEKTSDLDEEGVGSTMGKHFVVTLKFNKGRAVAMVSNVTEWMNGGYGTGNIED